MVKQQKKKNFFEKIAELDAKQEAGIVAYNKTSLKSRHKKDVEMSKTAKVIFVLLILGMPFFGWLIGALINPEGWMSDGPSIPFLVIYLAITNFWFIFIPIVIVIIALLIKRKAEAAIVIVFLLSVVASMYILSLTSNAAENEFTG